MGAAPAHHQVIVVGVDGSAPSLQALEWAAAVAAGRGATIVAVNAHQPDQSEVRPEYHERLVATRRAEMEQWCAAPLSDVPHRLEVIDGDARDVLLTLAEQLDPVLLVVSAEGVSGAKPGLLRLGSVAEHLAHQATVPLAIVPADGAPRPHRVVVAVDGSPHSKAAVRWLAELAVGSSLDIAAITVIDTALPAVGDTGAGWVLAAEQIIRADWAADLDTAGVEYDAIAVGEGSVVDGLLDTAHEVGADMLVMGMQGTGWFSGVRIGGKALQVVHRADITVVIVPPDVTG